MQQETTPKIEWRIELGECPTDLAFTKKGETTFSFRKYVDGKPKESYCLVNKETASVNAACIINGFEPLFPSILKEGSHTHPNE